MRDGDELRVELPDDIARVLAVLAGIGAEAALVGGCVRDLVRGDHPSDWDVATSAPPELVAASFPQSVWENPFGTVTVVSPAGDPPVEVTTYRVEAGYRDRRRPDRVEWGGSLAEDLSRRDFTINAMAWLPVDAARPGAVRGRLLDPFGGASDMESGLLRAVGIPAQRIAEDALRMLRAVRFATRFGMRLDAATEHAIRSHASLASGLSGERVRDELVRILAGGAPPSRAFELMESLGLLAVLLPELSALRGVPQAKALPGDALDHSLRTVDALSAEDPVLRLGGLLHDLGKASTLADGHFIGHDEEGAVLAEAVAVRLRLSRADTTRIRRLVRHHMFDYRSEWTDAAVRRFVRRVGADLLPDLFALRRADDEASGVRPAAGGGLDELQARASRIVAGDPLEQRQLAVDGDDLIDALGLAPGPRVGELLAGLLDDVIEEPGLNRRDALLERARQRLSAAGDGDRTHQEPGPRMGGDA